MLDQSFSKENVQGLLRREDVARFQLWDIAASPNPEAVAEKIAGEINAPTYQFPNFDTKLMRGKTVYSAPDATAALALRKLNLNIKSIYKVRQADRNLIIQQFKSLLREGCAFSVLRLDLSNFYESISRDFVINKIETDGIVSYSSRRLLKQLLALPQFSSISGVPRGLPISATLSELFLRRFDRRISENRQVYYYGRYVDDIVIFFHGELGELNKHIENVLNSEKVTLNPKKNTSLSFSNIRNKDDTTNLSFDFLGYKLIARKFLTDKKDWRKVEIGISDAKKNKIKSRISHAIADFSRNSNIGLLQDRLMFLSGNHVVKSSENGTLCAGIFYNYKHLTVKEDLDELTRFMRSLIYSRRGSLGNRLNSKLTDTGRKKLARFNFRVGFERKMTKRIGWTRLNEINQCWRYEKN